jgi:hypothetical protein
VACGRVVAVARARPSKCRIKDLEEAYVAVRLVKEKRIDYKDTDFANHLPAG